MISNLTMIAVRPEEVWLSWLKSEWDSSRFDHVRDTIIDPFKNDEIVLKTLRLEGKRHFLIDKIPDDTTWYKCNINSHDLKWSSIIPSKEWTERFPDSIMLGNAVTKLKLDKNLHNKINLIIGNEHKTNFELVLLSKTGSDFYTILEGNHRALALMKIANKVIDVYVGFSPNMDKSEWYSKKYV
ncbi:hypothetical protein HZB69_02805 [Candidatus Amesbacteria bacterium]|nr:hypothetical protein [Candidatus Amesbacteria bacterium]